MYSSSIRISRATNGYTAEFTDPKIEAKNHGDGKYQNADRQVVFTDKKELVTWLTNSIDSIMADTADEYGDAFSTATEDKDDG